MGHDVLLELPKGLLSKLILLNNLLTLESPICPVPLCCPFHTELLAFLWVVRGGIVPIVDLAVTHHSFPEAGPLHPRQLTVGLVADGLLGTAGQGSRFLLEAGLFSPVLIILPLEVGLAENIVGLVEFLKDGLIPINLVWMILLGKDVEFKFDFSQSSCSVNLKDLVVVLSHVDKGIVGSIAEVDPSNQRREAEGRTEAGKAEEVTCFQMH